MQCNAIIFLLEHRKNPSLGAFDQYYHLLMLINPKHVKRKLVSQGFFPNGDPFADEARYLQNDTKMEIILTDIRRCIARNGEEKFGDFVAVLLSDSMYIDLGEKLLSKHVHSFICTACTVIIQLYEFNFQHYSLSTLYCILALILIKVKNLVCWNLFCLVIIYCSTVVLYIGIIKVWGFWPKIITPKPT